MTGTPVRTLGPGSLTIGDTGSPREWGGNLTACKLTPKTDTDDATPMLDGTNMAGESTTTWTLNGTIQQDYQLDSLEQFCAENKGAEVPFVFTPNSAGGISWSGSITITPVEIGGDVKKRNTTDFEFALTGDPTAGAVTTP